MSSQKSKSQLHIGISGWTYTPWRGTFYPRGLRQADELSFASRMLNSIEINGTFYSLMKPKSFREWYAAVPEDFGFAMKGPRYITHIKRLGDVDEPLANFFASGVLALGKKLGPVLWQLPPSFKFDRERVERFLAKLPRTQKEVEGLAGKHNDVVKGRALLKAEEPVRLRHAMEVRHASFQTREFLELLRKYNVAVVIADTAGKWPQIEEVTADFVYLRLHGAEQLYVSGYTPEGLDQWAKKIKRWAKEGDVYAYFDNDVKVRSPADAVGLSERLGVEAGKARFAGLGDGPKLSGRKSEKPAEEATPRASWPAVRRWTEKKPLKKTVKRVAKRVKRR